MEKGTGKPLPLNHLLLIFYHMGHKLEQPPDCESKSNQSDSDRKD